MRAKRVASIPPMEWPTDGLLDSQAFQQLFGVGGQQVETVMDVGLGGLAETDLVRGDDPKAVMDKNFDGVPPVGGGEVLAVEVEI